MGRGFFPFILQLGGSIGVIAIGIWAVAQPKHLQGFLNENYGLLPAVRSRSTTITTVITTAVIRMAGLGLILYGYTLLSNYKAEMILLGKAFGVIPN
jgi:hypothetical protein